MMSVRNGWVIPTAAGVIFLLLSGCGNSSTSTKQDMAPSPKAAAPSALAAGQSAPPAPAPAPLPIPQVAPSASKAPSAPAPATSATGAASAPSAPTPPAPNPPPAANPPAANPPPAPTAAPTTAEILKLKPPGGEEGVILALPQGPVEIQLFEKDSPAHCQNFKRLVKSGYFNGTTFYRVCFGFIQGGDPTGTGKGGIEQTIAPEIKRPCLRGSIVAARRDDARNPARESHGSQFFILKQDQPSFTGRYTVFGQVVKGMEIVDRIPLGDKAQEYQVAAGAEKIIKAEVK